MRKGTFEIDVIAHAGLDDAVLYKATHTYEEIKQAIEDGFLPYVTQKQGDVTEYFHLCADSHSEMLGTSISFSNASFYVTISRDDMVNVYPLVYGSGGSDLQNVWIDRTDVIECYLSSNIPTGISRLKTNTYFKKITEQSGEILTNLSTRPINRTVATLNIDSRIKDCFVGYELTWDDVYFNFNNTSGSAITLPSDGLNIVTLWCYDLGLQFGEIR